MAQDVNAVTLVCRLTRDPELRALPSGTSVCSLRVAFSTRRKDPNSGEWGEKPNYADVTVWGRQGENVAQYKSKGDQIAVLGRLEWHEWTTQGGDKRQTLEIVAETVQFLGGGSDGGGGGERSSASQQTTADVPAGGDFAPAGTTAPVDDDIPF